MLSHLGAQGERGNRVDSIKRFSRRLSNSTQSRRRFEGGRCERQVEDVAAVVEVVKF
jgi:hypothetical protein